MTEKITANLERVFFHHILSNPNQILKVEAEYFNNDIIQFIFKIIKDEYIISKEKNVPSDEQIYNMVRLHDKDKIHEDNVIKAVLKEKNDKYGIDWIEPRFRAWKLSKIATNHVYQSVEYIRGLDELNYDNVVGVAQKIKTMFSDLDLIDDDYSNLEEDDFDNPENHKVTTTSKKIATGWSTIDKMTGGGWDQASLNVFMAQTGGGKCSHFNTPITIKHKITGEIKYITIGDFFNLLKK